MLWLPRDVERRTQKALDAGIDPQETSLRHFIVHNGLCMMNIRHGGEMHAPVSACLVSALEKADEKGGTPEAKAFCVPQGPHRAHRTLEPDILITWSEVTNGCSLRNTEVSE